VYCDRKDLKIKGVVLTFHLTGWIGQEQLLFSFTD